jgi:hypothetical protein
VAGYRVEHGKGLLLEHCDLPGASAGVGHHPMQDAPRGLEGILVLASLGADEGALIHGEPHARHRLQQHLGKRRGVRASVGDAGHLGDIVDEA